jgi:hypothetical protein
MSGEGQFNIAKIPFEIIMKMVNAAGITIFEMLRLLPDGMVLGVGILTFITFSLPYAILLLTMIEIMLVQRLIASTIGGIAPISGGKKASDSICMPGFMYTNNMRISLLETIGTPSMFPSPTLFFLTSLLTYMVGSMQDFDRELKTLNVDTNVRKNVAFGLSILLTLIVFSIRIVYGCETMGSLLVSIPLGFVLGILIIYQNKSLFGREGINLLNLPLIVTTLEKGRPMYVCGSNK